MDTPAKRLQWARKRAGFATATDAARSRGWPVSTYLGHENGDRTPSRETAKRYARAFKVRWEWLLEGGSLPEGRPVATVGGYVGAGAEVHPFDDQGKLDEIELGPGAPADVAAAIVRGGSMYPRYFDGEHLFYREAQTAPGELIGRECVVKLRDGRMLVKIIRRGSRRNVYNLESWNAPTMPDQAIEWAAPVLKPLDLISG